VQRRFAMDVDVPAFAARAPLDDAVLRHDPRARRTREDERSQRVVTN